MPAFRDDLHGTSRWHRPYVTLVTVVGGLCLAAAVAATVSQPTELPLVTLGLLLAVAALSCCVSVKLPEGNEVLPAQVGYVALTLTAGWPVAPLLAVIGRSVGVLVEMRQSRAAAQKFFWATYGAMAVAIPAVTVTVTSLALRGLEPSSWLAVAMMTLGLFLLDDFFSYQEAALAGWQNKDRQGGVSARWRSLLSSWPSSLPPNAAMLATGVLIAWGVTEVRYEVVTHAFIASGALPVLLRQRSYVLFQRAMSSLAAVMVMEIRDVYTKGHTLRVTLYTVLILKALKAAFRDLVDAVHAGYMHDLGKVETPDRVLQKTDKLDPEERAIMNRHVDDDLTGDRRWWWLLSRYPELRWLVELIRPGTWIEFLRRCHHLKLDGTGYPAAIQLHMKGNRIPLIARIMAVADTFDALTSTRRYRQGLSVEDALTIMRNPADGTYGGQLDPRIVDVLVRLVENGTIVPNDVRTDVLDEITKRFQQPGGNAVLFYLFGLVGTIGLGWLVLSLPGAPVWAIGLMVVPLSLAVWTSLSALVSSQGFHARLNEKIAAAAWRSE